MYQIYVILILFNVLVIGIFDVKRKFIFTHPQKCGGTSLEYTLLGTNMWDFEDEWFPWKHASLDDIMNEISRLGHNPNNFISFLL